MKKSWIVVSVVAMGLAVQVGVASAKAKKETNRQVLDRWFQVVDSKQIEKIPELETSDFEMRMPMGIIRGPEGHMQMAKGFATAFPNFKHVVERCIESGDLITCEGRFVGDHTGPLMTPDGQTIPATNKHVDFAFLGMAEVKGGKVANVHVYFDNMGFMQQLGLMPAPGAKPAAAPAKTK